MSLYPTKTRLLLLEAVGDGAVYQSTWFPYNDYIRVPGARARIVTSRMQEMHRAGWVEPGAPTGTHAIWRLTDAGLQLLDAHTSPKATP